MNSELLFLLYLFGRTIRKQANHTHGNQILEASILWLCSKGTNTARDLGTSLGVSASTISEQIRELIEKEYLKEQPNKEDKRAIILSLTGPGKAYLTSLTKRMDGMCISVLEPLNPEERMILSTLLKKLLLN